MTCCNELGLDEDYGWRVVRSVDAKAIVTATPASTDFAGFDGKFAVKADLDDASPLLEFTTTASALGSVMVFSENTIMVLLKKADIAALPENPDDASLPWTGWFEWTVTSVDELTTRVYQLPFIVERGAAE